MAVELSEKLLSNAAGWEAMKRARAYLEQGQVLSSFWEEPLLRGVVDVSGMSFRASIVIKGPVDMENLCTCREAREWGKICAHVVAVGLHWLRSRQPTAVTAAPRSGSRGVVSGTPNRGEASTNRPTGPRVTRGTSGEAAELFLIVPPNFLEASARGKVMLVLEAATSRGRGPLNALPRDQTYVFSAEDGAILDRIEELAGETPAMIVLETRDFVALLPRLAGHPRITLGKGARLEVSNETWVMPLSARLETNGEITVAVRDAKARPPLLGGSWVWEAQAGRLRPFGLSGPLAALLQGPMKIPRAQVPIFLTQFWPALLATGKVEADFAETDFVVEPAPPRFILELKGGLAQLTARLQCSYGARIMTMGVTRSDEALWLPDPDVMTRYSTRDPGAERNALARLQRVGFSAPNSEGKLQLNGQDAVLNFFAREFPRLQREWEVTLEERLERSTKQNLERIEPRFQVTPSGVQWFDLGVVYESTSGERFSAADIQRLVLGGQNHSRLKNGKIAVIDTGAVEEFQEVLLDCAPQQQANGYRMRANQAGFLDATLRQFPGWKVEAPSGWRERASRQGGEAKLECPPLGPLESVLRPYQKHGVAWLRFLRENGFGGILADEMGLGKTLQALAHLAVLRGTNGSGSGRPAPSLVVAPTSLVFNWQAEAARFAPELKVVILHGPGRQARFAEMPGADLVVTSYALVRRDAERYAEMEFDTVILDEAQHIKNRQTQNAQAVKSIRSRHRLVLTGTPLENSVLDLWSIFDFLMPGYLGSAQDFRERYEGPITREKNSEAQARLARRLRPFILRRTKREVAPELPARLEQVAFCELNDDQRSLYRQIFEATRREVLGAEGEAGAGRSRMIMLNALLRLRQVCCDPRLLRLEGEREDAGAAGTAPEGNASKTAQGTAAAKAGKVELFAELLEEVIDGGHRVLVFSQFTSMLALLRAELDAGAVRYCYLDGSTRDRAAVVSEFQRDAGIPVFLISLKAGGVGLNLTGADTVIHFDPWWNPAVEAQATDRAHRIGQTRVVTSYKLIARDTIEEKILTLQQRKREMISATIGDEHQFTEGLSWSEIQELLA